MEQFNDSQDLLGGMINELPNDFSISYIQMFPMHGD